MARLPHHSKNWGGKRPNSGCRGNNTGPNRMTKKAIAMAESANIHPFDYLLTVVADKTAQQRDRLSAAQAALPYCLTRLSSTEVNIKHALSDESEDMLVNRLLSAQNQLVELGLSVIEGEVVST